MSGKDERKLSEVESIKAKSRYLRGNLAAGIRTATKAPAESVGLSERGSLEAGMRADVMRFAVLGDIPVVKSVWSSGRQVA